MNAPTQTSRDRLADFGLKPLMSETEVHEATGISKGTLRVNRSKGTGLSYTKLGRAVRYLGADILAVLESNAVHTNGRALA